MEYFIFSLLFVSSPKIKYSYTLIMSRTPLIPNAQQYILQYKYCTINSDDRDIKKYPNAAEFEIELPQDYVNVQTVKLIRASFLTNMIPLLNLTTILCFDLWFGLIILLVGLVI